LSGWKFWQPRKQVAVLKIEEQINELCTEFRDRRDIEEKGTLYYAYWEGAIIGLIQLNHRLDSAKEEG